MRSSSTDGDHVPTDKSRSTRSSLMSKFGPLTFSFSSPFLLWCAAGGGCVPLEIAGAGQGPALGGSSRRLPGPTGWGLRRYSTVRYGWKTDTRISYCALYGTVLPKVDSIYSIRTTTRRRTTRYARQGRAYHNLVSRGAIRQCPLGGRKAVPAHSEASMRAVSCLGGIFLSPSRSVRDDKLPRLVRGCS